MKQDDSEQRTLVWLPRRTKREWEGLRQIGWRYAQRGSWLGLRNSGYR